MNKFISMDVETGGIETDKSLLELFVAVLDDKMKIVDKIHLKIKPDDGIYKVTSGALNVNKIDLTVHDAAAITESQASTKLYEFLEKVNPGGKLKLIPLGHVVSFDVQWVTAKLISTPTWNKYVSYRLLDSAVVGLFLKELGLIPSQVQGSLGSYVQFFDIEHGTLHTAEADVLATIEVLKAMMKLCGGASGKKRAS